jgi:phytoene synthase
MTVEVENYLTQSPEKVMANHGKSFFWASQVFSKPMLNSVARLYTFCRYVDDLADECPPDESQELLTKLMEQLGKGDAGFEDIFGPGKIDKIFAAELLDGALFDVKGQDIVTRKDLMVYCYKVAGVVGLMMTKVIGVKNPVAYSQAVDLGVAMQLTNICRDVLEDANNNRTYLPTKELEEAGLNVTLIAKKGKTPVALKKIVAFYLETADVYYNSAKQGMGHIPLRARFAILLAARLYQAIGHKLRHNQYNVLSGRTYLNKFEKLLVSFKTCFEVFTPSFWRTTKHNLELHQDLQGLPGIIKQEQ